MANRIILTGRLVDNPELRQTANGIPVTSFTIAVPRRYSKEKDKQADFIDVVAWRGCAEFVCKYFTKGKWIEVDGKLQTRIWKDKSDNKRKSTEVVADDVDFVGSKKTEEPAGQQTSPSVPADAFSGFPSDFLPDFSGMGDAFAVVTDSDDLPF